MRTWSDDNRGPWQPRCHRSLFEHSKRNYNALETREFGVTIHHLIIFDCDGVLVDSEPPSHAVLAELISSLGWPMDADEASKRFRGLASFDIWDKVAAHTGSPLPDTIEQRFRVRQFAALREHVRTFPGIFDVLEAITTPYCVASNGPHDKMQVTLSATGLMPYFEGAIFSRSDVARPKPAPDLFLHAAAHFGVKPEHALVIEDSTLGVRAAHAANMPVLGFAGGDSEQAQALLNAGAKKVMDHIAELLDHV